jgi:hypothetical protein
MPPQIVIPGQPEPCLQTLRRSLDLLEILTMNLCTSLPQGTVYSAPSASRASSLKHAISGLLAAADYVLSGTTQKLATLGGKFAGLRLNLDFVPRPDDLFIVTYPRSGTTWMQMILYQLATDGSLEFEHIYQVCPYFENSLGMKSGFANVPAPRTFKSHLTYRQIPKGCKYVYVARNGKDVVTSYFHFSRSHLGFRGTFDEFFDQFVRGKVESGSWFDHVQGWWAHRDDPNVLFLHYEDLLDDLDDCLRRIAAFCDLELELSRIPSIRERCSFAFMKAHENKFDHQMGMLWEQGVQWKSFIRQGRAGEGADRLSTPQAALFDQIYQKTLGSMGVEFSRNGHQPP